MQIAILVIAVDVDNLDNNIVETHQASRVKHSHGGPCCQVPKGSKGC